MYKLILHYGDHTTTKTNYNFAIMPEIQTIEPKSSWRDEYLKWICGFANAQGGTLFIGKDDNGNVVINNGSINNSDVQKLLYVSKPTATRLLKQSEKWLKKLGERGQGTNYVIKWRELIGSSLAHQWLLKNDTNE